MSSLRRARAFTLIEMVIALCLIVLIMAVGLPSITGQTRMRKLQTAYDQFDAFVAKAQQQSARDGKPYVLAWTSKGTVRLVAAEANDEKGRKIPAVDTFVPKDGEHFMLQRGSALTREPAMRWTFWPTGNCEPVNINYEGLVGGWNASYSPLSGRGTINRMIAN